MRTSDDANYSGDTVGYAFQNIQVSLVGLRLYLGGQSFTKVFVGAGAVDPLVGANVPFIDRHPLLRTVLGADGPTLQALLLRMTRDRVPFVPLQDRLQVALL